MKNVLNNPYRLIGILSNATQKERINQVNKIKKYLMASKDIENDYSFSCIGPIERTIDIIEKADKELYKSDERVKHALFWFYNGNPITDDVAFDRLKEGKVKEASEIWYGLVFDRLKEGKVKEASEIWYGPVKEKEISRKNWSAFQNLSSLYLCFYNKKKEINLNFLKYALLLKLKFLESIFFDDFLKNIGDETVLFLKNDIQKFFLMEVEQSLESNENEYLLIEILNNEEFLSKQSFFEHFIKKQIDKIDNKIERVREKRVSKPNNALLIGNEFYEEISKRINVLKGPQISLNSINMLTNRVAEEILQCGIDYINYYMDKNHKAINIDSIIDICNKAQSLAVSEITKQRCEENKKRIQAIKELAPVQEDAEYIANQINNITNKTPSIELAEWLIRDCKPKLDHIKKVLGPHNSEYVQISSTVVLVARSILIEVVNRAQEHCSSPSDIINLSRIIERAYNLYHAIEKMDMLMEIRQINIEQDKQTLSKLSRDVSAITHMINTSNRSRGNSTGCMVVIITILFFSILGYVLFNGVSKKEYFEVRSDIKNSCIKTDIKNLVSTAKSLDSSIKNAEWSIEYSQAELKKIRQFNGLGFIQNGQ
ncbi:MAG TPA: hypothetical protein PLX23_06310 [Candidatus Hydrogenedens sp.]|nr:hypothetical protein [Candidatus Hydrogenedens sp.]